MPLSYEFRTRKPLPRCHSFHPALKDHPEREAVGNRSLWRMATGSVLALAGLLTLPMLLCGPPPLSINVSESLPVGLYWTQSFRLPSGDEDNGHVDKTPSGDRGRGLEIGMLVSACLPLQVATSALERGYLPEGPCPSGVAPVGKIIAALAGDTVDVTDLGSFVNGQFLPESAPLLRDSRGRAMPQVRGRVVLPAGTAWLYSGHSPRSFDSRYYGPVPHSGIRGQLVPLLTAGENVPLEPIPEAVPEDPAAPGGPREEAIRAQASREAAAEPHSFNPQVIGECLIGAALSK